MDESFQLYIDGEFCDAENSAAFESIDPSTGVAWTQMPKASTADTNRTVAATHAAFIEGSWTALNATERGKLLYRLANLVTRDAVIIAELETRDTGKVIRETKAAAGYVAEFYRYFTGLADKIEGATLPIDKPNLEVSTRREPIGVVMVVVPWNSQMFLTASKLGPALAAGNTAIIMASEDGPAPLLHFAKLIHEAGFPKDVVNVITGFGADCGRVLTSHPLVARVAFTGGPDTARHVMHNTAENFAVTTLELGGKSPVLVFDDANLESALSSFIAGIWGAAGQSCVARSRLLIHESIHDDFVARLAKWACEIRIGHPLEMATKMGRLATGRQVQHAERLVAASVIEGATLVCGGKTRSGPRNYFEPAILLAPKANLPCVTEEFFGPVLSVFKFKTEDEAVALANGTVYAFAAGLFSQNLGRAHRLAKNIRAGVVWVNTYPAVFPIVPFGGNGHIGCGRESGIDAIHDYTRKKSIWINTSEVPMADPFIMRWG